EIYGYDKKGGPFQIVPEGGTEQQPGQDGNNEQIGSFKLSETVIQYQADCRTQQGKCSDIGVAVIGEPLKDVGISRIQAQQYRPAEISCKSAEEQGGEEGNGPPENFTGTEYFLPESVNEGT